MEEVVWEGGQGGKSNLNSNPMRNIFLVNTIFVGFEINFAGRNSFSGGFVREKIHIN